MASHPPGRSHRPNLTGAIVRSTTSLSSTAARRARRAHGPRASAALLRWRELTHDGSCPARQRFRSTRPPISSVRKGYLRRFAWSARLGQR